MNTIQMQLPDEFKTVIVDATKQAYREAMEQARRDYSITKELLTVKESMKYYDVSRNTLTKWLELGLPIYQVEGKRYIKKSDVNEFIESYRI